MLGKSLRLLTTFVVLSLFSPVVIGETSARANIEDGIAKTLAAFRDPDLTQPEKGRAFGRVVEQWFDFDLFARLTLGPRFAELTPAQQSEFTAELRKHVLGLCSTGTEQYRGQDVVIREDRPEGRADHLVQTSVMGVKEGAPRELARLDFRMRQREGTWKVIDVSIKNISLAGGFRAQFDAIMKSGGYERLIQLLREKNAAREAAAAAKDQPASK